MQKMFFGRYSAQRLVAGLVLALTVGGAALALKWWSRESNRREWAAAVARGDAVYEVIQVTTETGNTALVHCWKPRYSTLDVKFERVGDRVLVRAVPKDNANR